MIVSNELRILIACVAIFGTYGEEQCVTPSKLQGKCVIISECSSLLQLLRLSGITQDARAADTLRKSACGFQNTTPKVCCPIAEPRPATIGGPGPVQATQSSISDRLSNLVPGPPDVSRHRNLKLLDNDNCGRVTEGKIIGGNKTSVLEFPWMALIAYTVNKRTRSFLCGGTLINKRYVLTAAHCVTGLETGVELSGVRLGDHNLNRERDCDLQDGVEVVCADKYQNFFCESVHFHPAYRTNMLDNDIALIRLDGDADLRPLNVMPICLPIGDAATLRSKKVVVTGWGVTETRARSEELLKVRLELVPNNECDRIYQQSNGIRITYKQLCAGGKRKMDSCGGDSGGPMQFPEWINDAPKYVQHGVVSFGTTVCGIEGFPGVYTKIVYYMDWILDTMHQ